MRKKINLDWTANLWEVGSPILNGVREIGWQIEYADEQLEKAKKIHAETMAGIQSSANRITMQVASLWKPKQIAAAKRGEMLVDENEECAAKRAAPQEPRSAINIVLDGPPGPDSGRLVEVETDDGHSIEAGKWIERPDGLWSLRVTYLPNVL